MSDATKVLILAATTIITCILVGVGLLAMRTAKELNASAIEQMQDLNSDLQDSDIKKYHEIDVYGSDVINFIKKQLGDYKDGETAPIYVYVKTNLKEMTYTNGSQIKSMQNFTHVYYIKPTAVFHGEVVKNENDVILGVRFTQK